MKRLPLLGLFLLSPIVSLFGQTATVTPGTSTYSTAGGQMTFTVTLNYPADASAVSFAAKPPSASWFHAGTYGTHVPTVSPAVGSNTNPSDARTEFGWAYADLIPNTATFSFVLSYPASLTGSQTINFTADYRVGGVRTPITVNALTLTSTPNQTAPAFVVQPTNATVTSGTNATFTVVTTGAPAPTIKWQRSTDGGLIWSDLANDSTHSGVATSALTVSSTTLAMNAFRFRAIAANGVPNDANSNSAVLVVTQAPAITTQPMSVAITAGSPASFSITATGSGTLSYQWFFTPAGNSTPQSISGANSATYSIASAQAANAGDYVCVVTNNISSVTSNAAQLSIVPRLVRIVGQTAAPNSTVVVPVQLVANGNENAIGFSVSFDTNHLTFQSVAAGTAADGQFVPNDTQTASGKLGIAAGKAAGQTWSAGVQEIARITFLVKSTATDGTLSNLTFGDSPIAREIVNAEIVVLPGAYQGGVVTISSGYEADMNNSGTLTISDWAKVGRIVAGLDPAPTGIDFIKADCSPRLNTDGSLRRGNGSLTIADWAQAGRYAAGLDPLTPAGGPSSAP